MPTACELPREFCAPTGCETLADVPGRWWVCQCVPRHEKRLAFDLADRGLNYFLPFEHYVLRHGRNRTEIHRPIFPGYVFLASEELDDRYGPWGVRNWLADAGVGKVIQVIEVRNQRALLGQLDSLQRAIAANPHLSATVCPIEAGLAVYINDGPFQGITGTVLRIERPTCRVFISVDVLGTGVELEVDSAFVEPLN